MRNEAAALAPVLTTAMLALLATACTEPSTFDSSENETSTDDDAGTTDDPTGDPTTGDPTTGDPTDERDSCNYTSQFTSQAECRDYVGAAWTSTEVAADCAGVNGSVAVDQSCTNAGALGRCVTDAGSEWEIEVVIYGDDASSCDLQALGCENFAKGIWQPEPICEGSGDGGGNNSGNVFIQPTKVCMPPLEGEPPGQSANGEVCTWQAISASTEEGRHFADYASCDVVRSQRPYYAAPPAQQPSLDDPRLDDPSYKAELDWVREQIEASACGCCHTPSLAPEGTSNWYLSETGNWMDTFYDSGLALGANWVNSVAFGAYDPADNNGFDRQTSGFPSTDPQRMVAFFAAELAHRGRTQDEFADAPPFGGPLYDQLVYQPSGCENGEGVLADGSVVWTGGLARYVYVLEAGAQSPSVPPNLDLPDGTLWRIDVPWEDGEPITSGEVSYGAAPAGMLQHYPIDGGPTTLIPGQQYYLYVSRDVGLPITRCLFTY